MKLLSIIICQWKRADERGYSEAIGRARASGGKVLDVSFGAGEEDQVMSVEAETRVELV